MNTDSLAAVRSAILADAEREAAAIVERAHRDGDEIVARAERDVEAAVEQARHRAEITAQAQEAAALATAHRAAHEAVLRCEQEMRSALVDAVYERVDRLPDDARYPQLVDGLERLARTQLGDDAVIERVPGGGVVGTHGLRSVDYRLHRLADRAIASLAEEVATSCS